MKYKEKMINDDNDDDDNNFEIDFKLVEINFEK